MYVYIVFLESIHPRRVIIKNGKWLYIELYGQC